MILKQIIEFGNSVIGEEFDIEIKIISMWKYDCLTTVILQINFNKCQKFVFKIQFSINYIGGSAIKFSFIELNFWIQHNSMSDW